VAIKNKVLDDILVLAIISSCDLWLHYSVVVVCLNRLHLFVSILYTSIMSTRIRLYFNPFGAE